MLDPATYSRRRRELTAHVEGPVLLMGVGDRPRNLPMSPLPFRQDSSFLFFTGCALPGCAALLDGDGCTLFAPLPAPDDALWHGHVDSADTLCQHYGVEKVRPRSELERACAPMGDTLRTIAVADPIATAEAARLTGRALVFGAENGHDDLIDALILLRRTKDPEELDAHRRAAHATAGAFELAMSATAPGGHERGIASLFEAALAARGFTTGYPSIVTVRGEILHNFHRTQELKDGDLLLLDGGAEGPAGYGVDITRTWPVSGRFDPRQRAAYDAVLASQEAAIDLCRRGTRYRDVHLTSALVLARWLCDEGLLKGSPEDAVAAGAHALFYPHGVGHLLGLDVHDLEQFGDRAAYPPDRLRDPQFGLSYLRLDMDLEPGFLVTVEPGFYVVPAILDAPEFRRDYAEWVDFERAESWKGFGGIRIEDDVLVTDDAPEVLSAATPKDPDLLEELVGSGADALTRLSFQRA